MAAAAETAEKGEKEKKAEKPVFEPLARDPTAKVRERERVLC